LISVATRTTKKRAIAFWKENVKRKTLICTQIRYKLVCVHVPPEVLSMDKYVHIHPMQRCQRIIGIGIENKIDQEAWITILNRDRNSNSFSHSVWTVLSICCDKVNALLQSCSSGSAHGYSCYITVKRNLSLSLQK
jgi:hypothetical protein